MRSKDTAAYMVDEEFDLVFHPSPAMYKVAGSSECDSRRSWSFCALVRSAVE